MLLQAHVEQWIDFTTTAVDAPLCSWVYPLMGYFPFDKKVTEDAAETGSDTKTDMLEQPLCQGCSARNMLTFHASSISCAAAYSSQGSDSKVLYAAQLIQNIYHVAGEGDGQFSRQCGRECARYDTTELVTLCCRGRPCLGLLSGRP